MKPNLNQRDYGAKQTKKEFLYTIKCIYWKEQMNKRNQQRKKLKNVPENQQRKKQKSKNYMINIFRNILII